MDENKLFFFFFFFPCCLHQNIPQGGKDSHFQLGLLSLPGQASPKCFRAQNLQLDHKKTGSLQGEESAKLFQKSDFYFGCE